MSTTKSSTRSTNKFGLEDIDSMISKKSQPETAVGPSSAKPATRSKVNVNKRKRSAEQEDEMPLIERAMVAALTDGINAIKENYENKLSILNDKLKEIRASAAAKDDEISMALKVKRVAEKELTSLKEKSAEDVEVASKQAKKWATRAVLESRLKIVKEAQDPNFDRAAWNVEAWERTLAEMSDDEEEEDEVAIKKVPKSNARKGKEKLVEEKVEADDHQDEINDDEDGGAKDDEKEGEAAKDDDAAI